MVGNRSVDNIKLSARIVGGVTPLYGVRKMNGIEADRKKRHGVTFLGRSADKTLPKNVNP